MPSPTSRFSLVSRRAVLEGAGMAAVLGLAACASDEQALRGDTSRAATAGTTASAASTARATAAGSAAAGGGATGPLLPAAAKATIAFTYAAATSSGGGGKGGVVRNPYIAVWIEDATGRLVKTVALWYLAGKGDEWLNELARYYSLASRDRTPTSGTKAPGAYTLTWDGTDSSKSRVTAGHSHVCLESAREHGPYGLVRQAVTFGATPFTTPLDPAQELTAVTVTYAVA